MHSRDLDTVEEPPWNLSKPLPTPFLALETRSLSTDTRARTLNSLSVPVPHLDRVVFFWKRAQILVAETWAAFFPADSSAPHPIFPYGPGACISSLTMFADYRVPQILHHLGVLVYPPSLQEKLRNGEDIPSGSEEEISLRSASIVSVERLRDEILKLRGEVGRESWEEVNSVLIDFYLWDLAKRIETGKDKVEGVNSVEMLPAHRTRSIWY